MILPLSVPDTAQLIEHVTADYPQEIWFVPTIVLVILGLVAVIDARTGRVPLMFINFTSLAAFLSYAFYTGWIASLERGVGTLIVFIILWLMNRICLWTAKHDAFGMGDVFWSVAASYAFGPWPVFWAWVGGSCLAVLWLAARKLLEKVLTFFNNDYYEDHIYVHFVPFLMTALCFALFFGIQSP